ncbi:MAG: hypothetical protein V4547_13715 [Bacteroidota bacterium]
MKKFAYIFILLSCFGFSPIHAESVQIFKAQYTSELNRSEKGSIQKTPALSLNIVDSKESDHNPFSKKRKRAKKGLSPIFFCLADQVQLKIIFFEIELVYAPQVFHFSQLHHAYGERGPPTISLS